MHISKLLKVLNTHTRTHLLITNKATCEDVTTRTWFQKSPPFPSDGERISTLTHYYDLTCDDSDGGEYWDCLDSDIHSAFYMHGKERAHLEIIPETLLTKEVHEFTTFESDGELISNLTHYYAVACNDSNDADDRDCPDSDIHSVYVTVWHGRERAQLKVIQNH